MVEYLPQILSITWHKLSNSRNFANKEKYCHIFSLYFAFGSIERKSFQVDFCICFCFYNYTSYLMVLKQACTRFFSVEKPSENTQILLQNINLSNKTISFLNDDVTLVIKFYTLVFNMNSTIFHLIFIALYKT